jgi:DNA modification methylase
VSDYARLIHGSAHDLPLDAESVQMIATSPPYFGLRKYDGEQDVEWTSVTYAPMAGLPPLTIAGCDAECEHEWADGPAIAIGNAPSAKSTLTTNNGKGPREGDKYHHAQKQTATQGAYCQKCGGWRGPLGNEPTLESYIAHLILCAREWRRVLRDDGVIFLNLGDSYSTLKKWGGSTGGQHPLALHGNSGIGRGKQSHGIPDKNLLMVPARFALAMQADGWILRSEMVWAKPNPMPESVTDRPTKAHEMIYLFSKRERYFWDSDAVREPHVRLWDERNGGSIAGETGTSWHEAARGHGRNKKEPPLPNPLGRNLRTVLTVATQPFGGAHFAVWPAALVEPMIKAGSRPGDTVLDPFAGSGTTLKVALELGRRAVGVDISEEYLTDLAPQRMAVTIGMGI